MVSTSGTAGLLQVFPGQGRERVMARRGPWTAGKPNLRPGAREVAAINDRNFPSPCTYIPGKAPVHTHTLLGRRQTGTSPGKHFNGTTEMFSSRNPQNLARHRSTAPIVCLHTNKTHIGCRLLTGPGRSSRESQQLSQHMFKVTREDDMYGTSDAAQAMECSARRRTNSGGS